MNKQKNVCPWSVTGNEATSSFKAGFKTFDLEWSIIQGVHNALYTRIGWYKRG